MQKRDSKGYISYTAGNCTNSKNLNTIKTFTQKDTKAQNTRKKLKQAFIRKRWEYRLGTVGETNIY